MNFKITSALIVAILILGFVIMRYHKLYYRTKNELSATKINAYKIQQKIDSATVVVSQLRDSLDTTFDLLESQKLEYKKQKEQTAQYRKKYENIIFKHFDSDTARLRAWSELYPTLSNR